MKINGFRNVWIAKPNCNFLFKTKFFPEEEGYDVITIFMIS